MKRQDTKLPEHFSVLQDPTFSQSVQILQISRATGYRMICRGELDSYLVGKSRRIRRESIDRLRSGGAGCP
ncbi:MAG: helix-turn-helix domain-containing protein [Gammaproteobacteria bacterium]|nr:helix-turn-helix domain-containing protein [Gammaproteobacteria bacterium]